MGLIDRILGRDSDGSNDDDCCCGVEIEEIDSSDED